jgi:hypothetical protein
MVREKRGKCEGKGEKTKDKGEIEVKRVNKCKRGKKLAKKNA